jgi:hypothetical protein
MTIPTWRSTSTRQKRRVRRVVKPQKETINGKSSCEKWSAVAKYWIDPEVVLADSYEMNPAELNEIENDVRDNQSLIMETWNDDFGGNGSC